MFLNLVYNCAFQAMKYTFVPLVILKNSPCPRTRLTLIMVSRFNNAMMLNLRSEILSWLLYWIPSETNKV